MHHKANFSRFELCWQVIVFIFLAFSTIEIPLRISLQYSIENWHLFTDILTSTVFFLDIFFSKTIQYKYKKNILSKSKWPSLDSYLVIDIFASIPFDLVAYLLGLNFGIQILQLIRLARLVRILKIFKTINIFSLISNLMIVPHIIKFQFAIVCSIMAVNTIACGWILINPMYEGDIYTFYNKALYWTVTTLTTIGYGDITPTNNIGRIYSMIVMILGFGASSIVIGNILRILNLADRYKEKSREKINDLSQFMRHYSIPDQLQYAAFSYYNHLFSKRLSENDSKIISELPNALQAELQTYMTIKLIGNVPVFKQCGQNCLKEIAVALEQVYFSPRQTIIKQGEVGQEMFIIGHGTIDVVDKENNIISTLSEGQFFGEASLMHERERTHSVRAQNYCDLYKLSKDDFLRIIEKYPDLQVSFKKVMKRRSSDRRR